MGETKNGEVGGGTGREKQSEERQMRGAEREARSNERQGRLHT